MTRCRPGFLSHQPEIEAGRAVADLSPIQAPSGELAHDPFLQRLTHQAVGEGGVQRDPPTPVRRLHQDEGEAGSAKGSSGGWERDGTHKDATSGHQKFAESPRIRQVGFHRIAHGAPGRAIQENPR